MKFQGTNVLRHVVSFVAAVCARKYLENGEGEIKFAFTPQVGPSAMRSLALLTLFFWIESCRSFQLKTQPPHLHSMRRTRTRTTTPLMTMYPIPNSLFSKLSPRKVTMAQWYSYWGTNKMQRLQKILESVLLAYGGMWFSWFISFMAGPLVAALVGTAMIFNWMYTPWINSYNTNKAQWLYSGKKLKHAVFCGRIVRYVYSI